MKTNDSGSSANLRDSRVNLDAGYWVMDEIWGSWADPNDARDSLRIDTIEAPRSELRTEPSKAWRKPSPEDPATANPDVNRMLESTGTATVFLDRQLRVLRSTPAAKKIGYDRMAEAVEDARSVLDTLVPKQVEVQANSGRWYQMHLDPYVTLDEVIEGVVISFVDITEYRRAEQKFARELAEKEILLREVHHRLRNNIASIVGLLSIQAQSIADSEVRSVLEGAAGRVQSMSVLYDKLLVGEQYKASSVKNYLEDLADSVKALFPEGTKVTLEKRIADFDMTSDDLFLLGLIANELLTNVMKYAIAGRAEALIKLGLERSGNRVTLTVQDDGAGLPPGFDPESANGFGLSLVRMLSDQLGGSFSISTRDGTRSVLEFDL